MEFKEWPNNPDDALKELDELIKTQEEKNESYALSRIFEI